MTNLLKEQTRPSSQKRISVGDFSVTSKQLLCSIQRAADALIERKEQLNQINFFPVSDKDTGDNFAITLQNISDISYTARSFSDVLSAVAESVFEAASGNSGIIFSIWFTGLETYSTHKHTLNFVDIQACIAQGVGYLVDNMGEIAEGTMVTFLQDFSRSLIHCEHESDVYDLINTCLTETKNQNPVLKKYDVVDAGALGMAIFLKHLFKAMFLEEALRMVKKADEKNISFNHMTHEQVQDKPKYRYCTQAQIELEALHFDHDFSKVKAILEQFGDCDLLARRGYKVHFHLHTNDPQKLFSYLYDLGVVTRPKVEDILRQYQAYHASSSIALVTDSSADIDEHLIEKHQIYILPLSLSFDKHEALDPYTIDKPSFYSRLDQFSIYPKTASPNLKRTYSLLAYLEKYYDKILVVTLSSEMSGSYNSLLNVSKKFSKVFVLDSLKTSGAHGFLVSKAARLIHEQYAFNDILSKLNLYRKQVSIFVGVNSVSSILRSGRIKGLKATLLKIKKPKLILSVDSAGKSVVCDKLFKQKNIVDALIKRALASHSQTPFKRYCVLHVDNEQQASFFSERLSKIISLKPLFIDSVSSVIGVHAGKGAVAIAFDTGD